MLRLLPLVALAGCVVGEERGPLDYDGFVAAHIRELPAPGGGTLLAYDDDVPLGSPDDVAALYTAYVTAFAPGTELAASIVGSSTWSRAELADLSYCVADTFGDAKPAVLAALAEATAAWQVASAHRVGFSHRADADAACTTATAPVVFDVVPFDGAGLAALAFFPGDPRPKRRLHVDAATAFAPDAAFPAAGLLRHELGHLLGLRHETIRQPTAREHGARCLEDLVFRDVSRFFDEASVMLTPACLGVDGVRARNPGLVISYFDERGLERIYP